MNPLVTAAIENNAAWCAEVCAAYGIRTRTECGIWFTDGRPPRYYPDAITLNPEVTAEQAVARIGDRANASVKDSFATLALAPLGFDLLFAANWIAIGAPSPVAHHPRWPPVTTSGDLQCWHAAHGDADAIRAELLDDPNVAIVMGNVGDSGLAGAVAYRSESVVGISNVFTSGSDPVNAWQAVVANVTATFPGLPIAGYEHGEDLTAAIAAGFSEIGSLRVWVR